MAVEQGIEAMQPPTERSVTMTERDGAPSETLAKGREFIYRQGRVLERRLFATLFEGSPPEGVIDALRAYRNGDGGFGHGLEPDVRCPDSQPLDVEMALRAMDEAGAVDGDMVMGALDFLASVSSAEGGVPVLLPSVEEYPRAAHWGDWAYPPGLNPTAGIAGLLYKHGIEHPWLDRATDFCWAELSRGVPGDAHTMGEVLTFLAYVPDRQRAEEFIPTVTAALNGAAMFLSDPTSEEYGVTPLQIAPSPDSPWRGIFSDDAIAGHLDRLQRDQQTDGGWPVTWEPPSEDSLLAWRGAETLRALRTLRAYGRLG
jgi:hypothetical protein